MYKFRDYSTRSGFRFDISIIVNVAQAYYDWRIKIFAALKCLLLDSVSTVGVRGLHYKGLIPLTRASSNDIEGFGLKRVDPLEEGRNPWKSPTVALYVPLNLDVEAILMCLDSLKFPSYARNPHDGQRHSKPSKFLAWSFRTEFSQKDMSIYDFEKKRPLPFPSACRYREALPQEI
ncbi:hypothetical protein M9H77_17826 [Catharanthus roseus]|uniref:Uncharacterized protein n=1 Tax=Catharanthus roseus TaxID=4058 RepID=A0ACC0B617_CATRO|nr:hypothetical protein M9H77_17826 [Catharanthus roseus]